VAIHYIRTGTISSVCTFIFTFTFTPNENSWVRPRARTTNESSLYKAYNDVVVVFGCADVVQVPNAVVRRHGNTVVVKCNYNGLTYLLTCSNNRWKGDIANCSKGSLLQVL